MANSNTPSATVSTVPPVEIRDEVEGFSYNALAILGSNYLIKRWLPKKGPAFVALIQAMRAHIFYNFDTREQQTRYFPEAATIAQLTGISRASVFRLLNDPDMKRFIRRERRRRWDKVMHKEVTTSNRYYVALDDPPTPEDEHLVREAQERLAAITAHDSPIVDDDRPARRPRASAGKSSESQIETLIAVSESDSDSSLKLRREDRSSTRDFLREGTSIREGEAIGCETIRSASRSGRKSENEAQQIDQERETRSRGKVSAKRIESDRQEIGYAAPPPPCADVPSAALLSEGEAWKVDARVAAGGIIADNLKQLGGSGEREAVERVLSAHATYRTPAEILGQLADIARNRTRNRAGHIDGDAQAGYFITTLCNMASEAKRAHYDLAKLRKSTEKAARKAQAENRQAQGLPITPPQRSQMPRQSAYNRAGVRGHTGGNDDYYERLNAARYER